MDLKQKLMSIDLDLFDIEIAVELMDLLESLEWLELEKLENF